MKVEGLNSKEVHNFMASWMLDASRAVDPTDLVDISTPIAKVGQGIGTIIEDSLGPQKTIPSLATKSPSVGRRRR